MQRESAVEHAHPGVAGRTFAVTGASGYIGSALCARLASLGASLVRVTRDRERLRTLAGVNRGSVRDVEGCLRDMQTWSEALQGVHALIHLAGETSAVNAEKDP
ncbi:MAG: NAD(P)-dependent oxidoreductase, partial [Phycisphaerae bacterium]|nr:NAD(P)-dependent oxidoreductase [Phycisphaerae bacterium]